MIKYLKDFNLETESNLCMVANDTKRTKEIFQTLDLSMDDVKDETWTTIHSLNKLKAKKIFVIGQNKLEDDEAFEKVMKQFKSMKEDVVLLTDTFSDDEISILSDIVEGIVVNRYSYDQLKTKKDTSKAIIYIYGNPSIQEAMDQGMIYGESINQAKDYVNTPYNYMRAKDLADKAKALEKYEGVSVKIFDRKAIEEMNMGAYLGVNQGSSDDPYFIFVDYQASGNQDQPTALVGKGVMFDTGGYSLKPAKSMPGMKFDMAGSAAVLAAVEGIARLKLDTHVFAIVAATDNRIGDGALVPDDVITSANGKTIEIISTDAEGRLTLADAVWFAQKEGAKKIIDVATLTGACVMALSSYYTGAFTNDQTFLDQVMDASKKAKEKIWQLPLSQEFHKELKSQVADLKNKGNRMAGASSAAAFIENFIDDDTKWVHLDIAGTASDKSQCATGVMVKTFMKLFS